MIINSSHNSSEPSPFKKVGTFVCKTKFEYKKAKIYILFVTNFYRIHCNNECIF